MDPDRQLVRQAKKGNKAAFGKLAKRHRDAVLNLAYDILNDYENARDVAQEVFMKAFKNIGDFEEKSRFSSWLFRITVNAGLDAKKSKFRRGKYLRDKISRPVIETASAESERQFGMDDNLLAALNKLTDPQHSAIILRYFNDMSVREIADVLDCTESTVRSHLYRALQKLEKSFNRRK